jgi:hypothetical protein
MSGPWVGRRIAYAPYGPAMDQPGDRRRFVYWARARQVPFELAQPGESYDLVVLSARSDLSHWSRRLPGGPRVVFDLIDSYLDERMSWRRLVRGTAKYATGELSRWVPDYRALLERMCARADVVVCSTPEQLERLRPLNPRVHPILDVQIDDVRARKVDFTRGETFNLAWEGLPYTLDGFDVIADVLQTLNREVPVALHLVTALRFGQFGGRYRRRETVDVVRDILPGRTFLYEWNSELLSSVVTACDAAVIPLDLADPFMAGKPENKLLYFWRLGMPTVASATHSYRRVMEEAGIDLTCTTADDWLTHLRRLAASADERAAAATAGHRYVEDHHTAESALRRWDAAISDALGS